MQVILIIIVGGPRGRGFSRESRAVTLDKGLFVIMAVMRLNKVHFSREHLSVLLFLC